MHSPESKPVNELQIVTVHRKVFQFEKAYKALCGYVRDVIISNGDVDGRCWQVTHN
jgi:hypothetical protein